MHIGGLLCLYLCLHVDVAMCVHDKRRVNGLLTRVRSHFAVLSYSPETSESRSYDGDGGGLFLGLFLLYFMFQLPKY